MSAWTVQLETPMGPVLVSSDDDTAAEQRALNPTTPVLARSELDGVLTRATETAPPDYLRLTLWRELRALVALKRALPGAGLATIQPRREPPEPAVELPEAPTQSAPPAIPAAPTRQQLDLL